MTTDRLRFWLYLAATYVALMLPVGAVMIWIIERNRPEASLADYGPGLAWFCLWPVVTAFALMCIWYLGAVTAFVFWKYAELIQFVTNAQFGSRLGRAIARDHFFANAPPTSPYAWVHRQAVAAYPTEMDATRDA